MVTDDTARDDELHDAAHPFTHKVAAQLAQQAGKQLDHAQTARFAEHLNGAAFQFLSIDWPLEQRQTNTEIARKLDAVHSAINTLSTKLDPDVLSLITSALQEKVEKECWTSTGRRVIGAAEEEERERRLLTLMAEVPKVIAALADGIDGAQKIVERRKEGARGKENTGNRALDQLCWNLLAGYKRYLHPRVRLWVGDAAGCSPAIRFMQACFKIFSDVLPSDCPKRSELLHALRPSDTALRDRIKRMPRRMLRRFQWARRIRESRAIK
ncbi:hypothetical protein [Paraburkholderia flagellata]|uniref:hypothetical protein n=1 Tax=Paraburkholderia flagellata TaxID=2883241 RepID=UPI001F340C4E|nr:hypothetical protein [Paraburkholderia flagellata]